MRKSIPLLIFCFSMLNSYNGTSQYYDGWLDTVAKLGYEPGTNSYGILGMEAGLGRYLSVGMGFKYLLTSEDEIPTAPSPFNIGLDTESKFAFSLRADLHGFYLFDLKKSDILVGYNNMHGVSGTHAEYRHFFNEFLAIYGRGKYHFKRPEVSVSTDNFLKSKLRLEIGVLFKTFSGNSYNNTDW